MYSIIQTTRARFNRAELYSDEILLMIGQPYDIPEIDYFRMSLTAQENVVRVTIPKVLQNLDEEIIRLKKQGDP